MDTLERPTVETRIARITPFEGEGAVAGVTLKYGPVYINAYLRKNARGEYFLSYPARKGNDEKWYDHTRIADEGLRDHFTRLAVELYHTQVGFAA